MHYLGTRGGRSSTAPIVLVILSMEEAAGGVDWETVITATTVD
jgi:hypothetical protein